ncbi:hypothetical protein HPB50_012423 [Hyalomma asiaticum]|uniref:Uncharacterized protein n=1 Tax=Hyalomma asiaticum TaxID=266040 RepID=A0ACB7SYB2_HYAAI|nr:hypothetical protein HPB50_012423 [Hyalomma asiaticum]
MTRSRQPPSVSQGRPGYDGVTARIRSIRVAARVTFDAAPAAASADLASTLHWLLISLLVRTSRTLGKVYVYDKVFKPNATQEKVYNEAAKAIVKGDGEAPQLACRSLSAEQKRDISRGTAVAEPRRRDAAAYRIVYAVWRPPQRMTRRSVGDAFS